MPTIKLYKLYRKGDRYIKWEGPDGETHSIDALNPPNPPNSWAITLDSSGDPVMAYSPNALGSDGTLVVSLDGAPSIAATLLHEEDDTARKYYFATDGGNGNILGRKAFILRCEGLTNSPLLRWANFKVMVVVP